MCVNVCVCVGGGVQQRGTRLRQRPQHANNKSTPSLYPSQCHTSTACCACAQAARAAEPLAVAPAALAPAGLHPLWLTGCTRRDCIGVLQQQQQVCACHNSAHGVSCCHVLHMLTPQPHAACCEQQRSLAVCPQPSKHTVITAQALQHSHQSRQSFTAKSAQHRHFPADLTSTHHSSAEGLWLLAPCCYCCCWQPGQLLPQHRQPANPACCRCCCRRFHRRCQQ